MSSSLRRHVVLSLGRAGRARLRGRRARRLWVGPTFLPPRPAARRVAVPSACLVVVVVASGRTLRYCYCDCCPREGSREDAILRTRRGNGASFCWCCCPPPPAATGTSSPFRASRRCRSRCGVGTPGVGSTVCRRRCPGGLTRLRPPDTPARGWATRMMQAPC